MKNNFLFVVMLFVSVIGAYSQPLYDKIDINRVRDLGIDSVCVLVLGNEECYSKVIISEEYVDYWQGNKLRRRFNDDVFLRDGIYEKYYTDNTLKHIVVGVKFKISEIESNALRISRVDSEKNILREESLIDKTITVNQTNVYDSNNRLVSSLFENPDRNLHYQYNEVTSLFSKEQHCLVMNESGMLVEKKVESERVLYEERYKETSISSKSIEISHNNSLFVYVSIFSDLSSVVMIEESQKEGVKSRTWYENSNFRSVETHCYLPNGLISHYLELGWSAFFVYYNEGVALNYPE